MIQNLFWQGVINLVGALVVIPIWKNISTPALQLSQALTFLSGLILIIRFRGRKHPEVTSNQASFTFLINMVPVLLMIAISNLVSGQHPEQDIGFQTTKLSLLTVSLLAPPKLWVGLAGISALTLEALIQLAQYSRDVRIRIGHDEPAATLIFAIFAIALFIFRLRSLKTQTEALRAEAEALSMRTQMHRLVALKDLMGSPLQTLELGLALIERSCPECQNISRRCNRSVAQLSELSTRIYEQIERMDPKLTPLSFDALDKFKTGK